MHLTPLHLDVAHHFRQTCAALTGAALFGTFSAAPRQGPRRRGPLLLNKKNCRASMICITICISFCFHLCKMAKPKMQWRLRCFWNTARFRARRRGISNDPGHLHILSGVRAYHPWMARPDRASHPAVRVYTARGVERSWSDPPSFCDFVPALEHDLVKSGMGTQTDADIALFGHPRKRIDLAILEKELIASLSWLLIRPQSPSG